MKIVRALFNLFRFDRANWKAVVLCVLTAIVFWVFNAFNKNYSTNIRFPLLFEFDGEKYAQAEHLPKTINLNVSGNGWELFRKRFGVKVPPLIIPLERPNEIKKIVGSTLPPMLVTQVGNLKINFVVTDTLYLQIDRLDSYRYKLVADTRTLTFREGFGRISPVVVLPDSVNLKGPRRWLQSLGDTIRLVVNEKNISEDFRDEVEIEFPGSEFVKRNPPVAQVMFEVAPVVAVRKKLKVETDQKTDLGLQDSVTARFQIPANQTEDFNHLVKEIILQVNIKYLKRNKVMVPVVLNLPSYAVLLTIDSVHITPTK